MAIDYEKFSTEDLLAIKDKKWDAVSTKGLEMMLEGGVIEGEPPKKGDGGPSVIQWLRDGALRISRPALEMGGAITGGIVGAPAGPAGAIAGAAIGGAIGSQAANLVEQAAGTRKPGPIMDEAGNVIKDLAVGATTEMGGRVGSKIVEEGAKKLAPVARWLYSRSINTPTGMNKLYKGHELSQREALVQAGMEEGALPNAYGMRKVASSVDDIMTTLKNRVDEVTAQGTNRTPVSKITGSPQFQEVEGRAWASGDSGTAKEAVGGVKKEVGRMGGYVSSLSPTDTLALKQQFTKEIDWIKQDKIVNVKNQFTKDAKKAAAEAAMVQLEGMSEEIKYLSKKSAARLDLMKAIETTMDRELSKDVVKMGSKMLALKNIGMAVLDSFLGYHTNQARLAFAIQKGAQYKARILARGAAYGMADSMRGGNSGDTIAKYDINGVRMVQ